MNSKHKMPGWAQNAEWLSVLTVCLGGYFSFAKPSEEAAVIAYRLALVLVGTAGYLAIQTWKRRSSKRESR